MKENSLPKKILLAIGDQAKDLLDAGLTIIFDPRTTLRGYSLYRDYSTNHSRIYSGIYSLKRHGYLKENKIKGEKRLYLTLKGRAVLIKSILKQKRERRLKWDGNWRAIIFDIPELSRKDRDFLRRELQWVGFKELQKSIWVFPYDFRKEFEALLKLWKIEFKGDIRFLLIKEIEDGDLKEHFNLK